MDRPALGALLTPDGCCFRLWSTRALTASVVFFDLQGKVIREVSMTSRGNGIFEAWIPGAGVGDRYKFRLNGDGPFPDPYARRLPQGVHGPAEIVAFDHAWRHPDWPGVAMENLIIYELHVGTFTPEGTFSGLKKRLPYLAALGVTAIELMPISSFPGQHGWGYDGVAHFAPHAAYGTPEALCELIDSAHGHGLAVLLDVVYNHFGPDGNYLGVYSPEYFTSAHKTPWGDAPNFDQPHREHMRAYVLDNARYWLETFRFDGLRLDATQTIQDNSERHILADLAETVRQLPGKIVIAEDDRNLPILIRGYGVDGVWVDDFHHQVHTLLTRENDGYYADYRPVVADLAKTISNGWLYQGEISPHLGRPRGEPAGDLPAESLVYCIQNHDQIGNRAFGERLNQLTSSERYRTVSVLLLFLPFTPLIFMGQEWAADSPFLYFTDHHPELGALVTQGRRDEFKHFHAFSKEETIRRIPDPQAYATLHSSRLNWSELERAPHADILALYRQMIHLRRTDPVLRKQSRRQMAVGTCVGDMLWVHRWDGAEHRLLLVNFGKEHPLSALGLPSAFRWKPLLSTAAAPGGANVLPMHSAIILCAREGEQV